mmetsp:Transcript_6134/g.7022  ORF Transcript_6134/g.7022 Transcript_6134/m.7022 type:complete len:380 (+) Transcript_6134:68-1207(+)
MIIMAFEVSPKYLLFVLISWVVVYTLAYNSCNVDSLFRTKNLNEDALSLQKTHKYIREEAEEAADLSPALKQAVNSYLLSLQNENKPLQKEKEAAKPFLNISAVGKDDAVVAFGENNVVADKKIVWKTGKDVCVINTHIPKTGGLSLATWIDALTDHHKLEHYSRYQHMTDDLINKDKPRWITGQTYTGHWTPEFASMVEKLGHKTCYVITMIRHPYLRVVSAIRFHKKDTPDWSRWFNHYTWQTREYQNHMVTMLASTYGWDHFNQVKFRSAHPPTEKDLAKAMLVIENITFGITEYFPESLQLVENRLPPVADKRFDSVISLMRGQHINENKNQLSTLELKKLKLVIKHNELDMKLYTYAIDLFRARYYKAFGKHLT